MPKLQKLQYSTSYIPTGVYAEGRYQKEKGHQKQAYKNTAETYQTKVISHHRAFIIIFRALGKLKYSTGQDQRLRRIIHDKQDIPLHKIAAGDIRTFRTVQARQRIILFFMHQKLFQTFRSHFVTEKMCFSLIKLLGQ